MSKAPSIAGETKDGRGDEMKKQNKHVGSSLDDFLKEEGAAYAY